MIEAAKSTCDHPACTGPLTLFEQAAIARADSLASVEASRALSLTLRARKHSDLQKVPAISALTVLTPVASERRRFDFPVVVIAASAGGLRPLLRILLDLPASGFPGAVLILQHQSPRGRLAAFLAKRAEIPVKEAADGDALQPGAVLVCPPAHHIRVQDSGCVSVWSGPHIDFVRPSADVAFTSLGSVVGGRAVAVILSGCGWDGAMGSREVRRGGGMVIAEDARSAAYAGMPAAAAAIGHVDLILPADQIGSALMYLTIAPIAPLQTA